MSGEFARRWCDDWEIVEDAGFAATVSVTTSCASARASSQWSSVIGATMRPDRWACQLWTGDHLGRQAENALRLRCAILSNDRIDAIARSSLS
jgi:hypothetical protein